MVSLSPNCLSFTRNTKLASHTHTHTMPPLLCASCGRGLSRSTRHIIVTCSQTFDIYPLRFHLILLSLQLFLLQHNTSLSIHSRHQLVQVPLQLAQLCSSLLESVVVSMEQHHTPSKCNTLCPPIIYIIKHQSSISIFQPFALTQPN